MLAISRSRPITLLGTCVLLAACSDGVYTVSGPASDSELAMSVGAYHQSTMTNWHAQQLGFGRSGAVAGASATLVRNATGISFRAAFSAGARGPLVLVLWLGHSSRASMRSPALRAALTYASIGLWNVQV